MSAAQACVAGTSGCAGGTHSETFMVTVLSCAAAGFIAGGIAETTHAAASPAKIAFLIEVAPVSCEPVLLDVITKP